MITVIEITKDYIRYVVSGVEGTFSAYVHNFPKNVKIGDRF